MKLFTKGRNKVFWSTKNPSEALNKFKCKDCKAPKLSTYDFCILYTTLPHHLITDKLIDLIDRTFFGRKYYTKFARKNVFFSLLVYTRVIIHGFIKKSVTPF